MSKKRKHSDTGEKVLASGLFNPSEESRHSTERELPSPQETPAAAASAASDHLVRAVKSGMVAKKNFVIRQAPYLREIKVGDDLSDVPEKYHANLRTEGVL